MKAILPYTADYGFVMTKWTIEISNLPPQTDEPALRKLLTSRMSTSMQSSFTESQGISTRRSLKRKLSFQVSFASERQMQEAIDILNQAETADGKKMDICKVEEEAPKDDDLKSEEGAPKVDFLKEEGEAP